MTTTPSQQSPEPIVARAGTYFRNTRYIMCALLIGLGFWFGYDGFVGYPKLNQKIAVLRADYEKAANARDQGRANRLLEEMKLLGAPKTDMDIFIQKLLWFGLPPLGILLLIRALHISRGEYRLEGTTLQVPGHPPVPFENITEIDRRLWDRKGIAYVSYDLGDGRQGRIKLDDFLYDRPPTDEIFKRIENYVTPVEKVEPSAPDSVAGG